MDVLASARALADSALFGELTADALLALAERAMLRTAGDGAVLPLAADEVAIVVRGAIRDHDRVIGVGDAVKLISALTGAPRASGAARAVGDAAVLVLRHDDLVDVLTEQPAALRALLGVLAAPMREHAS